MKKSEKDSKPSEERPVTKATMDAPQEEFIEDQAGIASDEQADEGRRKETPPSDKKTIEPADS